MKTNLDVWAIQYYPEALKSALDNLKSDGEIFLLKNCKCNFTIADKIINSRCFDTVLYSDDSDLLVMLMKAGKAKYTDIVNYLKDRGVAYLEEDFGWEDKDYKDGDNIPEIWFIRENYVLQDALEESKSRNILFTKFYKDTRSNLVLLDKENKELIRIQGKGLLELDDKICIIIEHGFSKNMSQDQVKECISKSGIECEVVEKDEPNVIVEQFSKKILKFL